MAPRLNNRRKPPQRAVTTKDPATTALGGDGRVLKPSDNRKAVLEAEEAQLLSFVGRLKAQLALVNEAKAALKIEQDSYTEIVRLAGIAGFKKYELKDLMEDLGVKRKDLTETEARRARFRSYLGLPVGNSDEQLELATDTEKGEIEWEADGYKCGILGTDPVPPHEAGVHGQAWLKGYHNGQARNAWALDAAAKGQIPAPQPAEEKAIADERAAERKQDRQAKEALAKLAGPAVACSTCHGDGTGLDTNVEKCPACGAEYEPLANEGDMKAGEMAAGVIHEPGTNGIEHAAEGLAEHPDGFEASPEELAAQIGRQVVLETRDAETEAADSI